MSNGARLVDLKDCIQRYSDKKRLSLGGPLDFHRAGAVCACCSERTCATRWYLPTAMTCFAGFTYGNASPGEVRDAFISPLGHKLLRWHPGLPATATGRQQAFVPLTSLLLYSHLMLTQVAQAQGQLPEIYCAPLLWFWLNIKWRFSVQYTL